MPPVSTTNTSFQDPSVALENLAKNAEPSHLVNSLEFAKFLDQNDPLRDFRQKFHMDDQTLYFCGNSLGMPPKKAKTYIDEVYDNWAKL